MQRTYSTPEVALATAAQALKLAYDAAVPMGMGFLQAAPGPLPAEELSHCIRTVGGNSLVYADYLVGRMMKFRLRIDGCTVDGEDGLRADYQSWCRVYPTFEALLDAAEASLSSGSTGKPETMTHAEKIAYMQKWCADNNAELRLEGECGFGRECVGIIAQYADVYPDYEWSDDETFERLDNNGVMWIPEDAYHKHPCVAVLGRGMHAEAQLYEWIRWFVENGFVLETGDVPGVTDPVLRIFGKHRFARMVRQNPAVKAVAS